MIYLKFLTNKRREELKTLVKDYGVAKMPLIEFNVKRKENSSIYGIVFQIEEEEMWKINQEKQLNELKQKFLTLSSIKDYEQKQDHELELKNLECEIEKNRNLTYGEYKRRKTDELEDKINIYFKGNKNVQKLEQEDVDYLYKKISSSYVDENL